MSKIRKRFFLFTGIMLLIALSVNAQYTFSPSTTLTKNQVLNTMTYDSVRITNTSTDTLLLNWELISYDTISGSYFDFCSSGVCWIGIPTTGSFPPIPPGNFGYAGAHFWTGNVQASASTTFRVYEQGSPAGGDTLTFVLNATANGIHENSIDCEISVYPNPTSENIDVCTPKDRQFSVYIFDAAGRKLLEGKTQERISLKNMEPGSYLVVLKDTDGNIFTRVIQKSNF